MMSGQLPADRLKPVMVTRCGQFWDARWGDFEITTAMLDQMVVNFENNALGADVFVDLNHDPGLGAAGRFVQLWRDQDKLMALVDWTPFGRIAIEEKGFSYLSAEYVENYVDNEFKQPYGCVLKGAALTLRPVVKRLERVELSEASRVHAAIAGTGCDAEAVRRLTDNYLTIAETLSDPAVRAEMAVQFVQLADGLPKARPTPKPKTAQQIVREVQLKQAGEERERQARLRARRDCVENLLADSRRFRYFNEGMANSLRELAESQLTPDMDDSVFHALMESLKDESLRRASQASTRVMATTRWWYS